MHRLPSGATGTAPRGKDFRVDARFSTPGIDLQLRTYNHAAPSHDIKARQDHVLSVSLSGRPRGAVGHFIRDRRQTGPFGFGNVTFVPGGVPIVGRGPGGVQQTLSCRFDYGAFPELSLFEDGEPGGSLSDERLLACGDIRAPHMEDMMRRLAWELRSPGFGRDTMIDLLVRAAMVDVVRHVQQDKGKEPLGQGGLSPAQLRRVTACIAETLHRSPTISELGELCGVSPGHLMRAFRQSTGETIHAHVQRVRGERAKALLGARDHSIKAIAYMLGFATPGGFSVAFRRFSGQSPSEYREATLGSRP